MTEALARDIAEIKINGANCDPRNLPIRVYAGQGVAWGVFQPIG
jgi:hypothetical protein